jgi:hypothetical protein
MSPQWVPWVEKIVVGREFMIGLQNLIPYYKTLQTKVRKNEGTK